MSGDGEGEYSTPEGEEYALPVSEVAPGDPAGEPSNPVVRAPVQQNAAREPNEEQRECQMADPAKPLLITVVKDDHPGAFERRSLQLGWAGFLLGVLSLLAACIAAYYVARQFHEMAKQTKILSDTLEKAKADSVQAGKDTEAQLRILQGQLTQEQEAMKVDQRAWVSIAGTGMVYKKSKAGTSIVVAVIDILNPGHSPAKQVRGWRCAEVMQHEPLISRQMPPTLGCRKTNIGTMGPTVKSTINSSDDSQETKENTLSVWADDPGDHLYLWGVIAYEDIFRGKTHFTKFCLVGSFPQLSPCSKGNSAD